MPDKIDRDSDEFQVKLQNYKRKGMNHGRAIIVAELELLAERAEKDSVKTIRKTKKKRVVENAID